MTTSQRNLIVPIIHSNGTSREELLALRERAYASLGDAVNALKQMAPNGRDYYPGGVGALEAAIEQHSRRLAAVFALMDELSAECRAIEAAGR